MAEDRPTNPAGEAPEERSEGAEERTEDPPREARERPAPGAGESRRHFVDGAREAQPGGFLEVVFGRLTLVLMGFVVIVLLLMIVGYAGSKYYEAQKEREEAELLKQTAFTADMTLEEFKGLGDRDREQEETGHDHDEHAGSAGEAGSDHETAAAGGDEAAEAGSPEAEEAPDLKRGEIQIYEPLSAARTAPPPDLDLTDAEKAALRGKAALIHTTVGTLVVELYAEKAPVLVKNFVHLAEHDYYDGLYFHRSTPGAYIQGGSPNGRRNYTPGYRFLLPLSPLEAKVGTIAMLPGVGTQMGGSEFVIFIHDGTSFEGQCAVFGRIIDRFDVAQKCCETWVDMEGYSLNRTYITDVEIVDLESVRPEKDFWAEYGAP